MQGGGKGALSRTGKRYPVDLCACFALGCWYMYVHAYANGMYMCVHGRVREVLENGILYGASGSKPGRRQ